MRGKLATYTRKGPVLSFFHKPNVSYYGGDGTNPEDKRPMQFGIVITLKEMYGENRIDDFIKMCEARGWLVSHLDVQNQLDIYTPAEEHIEFE